MLKINFKPLPNHLTEYKNNGQRLEQIARYNLTGQIVKADNLSAEKSTDCLQYQIKSSKATICKGSDLNAIDHEKATAFIYVCKDLTAYIMNKSEYKEFVKLFTYVDRESPKNGNAEKLRLYGESKKMLEYLENKVNQRPKGRWLTIAQNLRIKIIN